MLLLGDRNYPLAPTIKIPAVLTAPLSGLLTEAQARVPDVTYDDLLKAVWLLGIQHVTAALEAGSSIERQGVVKAPPPPPQKAPPSKVPVSKASKAVLHIEDTGALGVGVTVVNEPDGSLT